MGKTEFKLFGVYEDLGGETEAAYAIVMQLEPLNIARLLTENGVHKIPQHTVSSVRKPEFLRGLKRVLSVDEVKEAMLQGGWKKEIVDELI